MIKAVIFDLDGTLYEPRFFPLRLILADPGNILKLAAERRCRRQLQGRCFGSGDEYYDELFLLMGKGNEEKAQRCREWFWRRYLPNQVRIIREDFYKRPQLKDLMLSGTPVTASYNIREAGQRTGKTTGGYKGKYIITSLDLDGQAGDDAKYTVQLENYGKVEKQTDGLQSGASSVTEHSE